MIESDDERIERYIERLSELSSKEDTETGAERLRDIAIEVGINPQQVEAASKRAAAALMRGKGLLASRRYGEAIENLRLAVDLLPYNAEAARELGRAYSMRGKAVGSDKDDDEAQRWLERALKLDPDDEQTRHLLAPAPGPPSPPPNRSRVTGWALILVGSLVGGAAAIALMQRGTERRRADEMASPPAVARERARAPSAASTAKREGISPAARRAMAIAPMEVPITLLADKRMGESKLLNQQATLKVYTSKSWLSGYFELHWLGSGELEMLQVELTACDENGASLAAKTLSLLRSYQGARRPGDRIAARFLMKVASSVRKLKLRPVVVRRQPAASSYPAAKPLAVRWLAKAPLGVQLFVGLRNEISRRSSTNKVFSKLDLVFRNDGERALRRLKFDVRYMDGKGEVLTAVSRYLLIKSDPPLLPKTERIKQVLKTVAGKSTSWQLVIVEAE